MTVVMFTLQGSMVMSVVVVRLLVAVLVVMTW
jgi:hypothetical protein